MRHGEAQSSAIDAKRGLTPHGKDVVRKMAEYLKKNNVTVDKVYHSLKLRAKETAEIIADAINAPLEEKIGLAPEDSVQKWEEQLYAETGNIYIVSHLPFVANLFSLLLTGDEQLLSPLFKTATIACLEKSFSGGWHLQWITPSEIIE